MATGGALRHLQVPTNRGQLSPGGRALTLPPPPPSRHPKMGEDAPSTSQQSWGRQHVSQFIAAGRSSGGS